MSWHELRNGDLLLAAEREGFDVLITSDKNIRHQNRLASMRLAILELGTNHWPTLQRHAALVSAAFRPQTRRVPASGVPAAATNQATATGLRWAGLTCEPAPNE
jgi:hypothetical protein